MKGSAQKGGDGEGDKPAKGAQAGFDENLAALEEIVSLLDQQALGLEPALAKYREGVQLLKQCQTMLDSFQKQVEELSAEDDGTRPYPNDPDVRAAAN